MQDNTDLVPVYSFMVNFALIKSSLYIFVKFGILNWYYHQSSGTITTFFSFLGITSRKLKAHITLWMKMWISVIRNTSIVTLNEGHILTRRFIMRVTSRHAAETTLWTVLHRSCSNDSLVLWGFLINSVMGEISYVLLLLSLCDICHIIIVF